MLYGRYLCQLDASAGYLDKLLVLRRQIRVDYDFFFFFFLLYRSQRVNSECDDVTLPIMMTIGNT